MPGHPSLPLGDVCEIVGGGTPKRKNPEYFGGEIPWATPTDVTALDDLPLTATKEMITELGLQESSARLLPTGTVLMTSRATIGYTAIAQAPTATNQGFANLICSDRLLPEYVARWLPTQRDRLLQVAGGTTFKEISKGELKKITIPVPPIDEQRRIVDILNRAASIERLRAQANAHLHDLIPALFIKMFGDPIDNPMGWNVDDLGNHISGGPQNGLYRPKSDYGEGTRILRIDGFYEGRTVEQDKWQRLRLDEEAIERYALKKDDIVINRVNSRPYLGKSTIIPKLEEPSVFESNMMRFSANSQSLLPQFLIEQLQLNSMRDLLRKNAKDAINQSSINQTDVRTLAIIVPPVTQQAKFVELISSAAEFDGVFNSAGELAKELGSSLMEHAFGSRN